MERQGCAQGVGYAAAAHLDIVVDYLVNADATTAAKKEGGGFLSGLFSKKSAVAVPAAEVDGKQVLAAAGERGKATIVLCYGYVCAYGPPAQVTARVDVHIVKSMAPHLLAAKSLSFKRAAIAALDLIGKAVHPVSRAVISVHCR